jgi:hypothetical protein
MKTELQRGNVDSLRPISAVIRRPESATKYNQVIKPKKYFNYK